MQSSGVEGVVRPIERRSFIKLLLGLSAVVTLVIVAAPIVGFLVPTTSRGSRTGGRVLAGTTDDIPVGSGKVVAMGSQPVIVIDMASGVKAYSAVCTHLGCIVTYDKALGHIFCPCHDGHYSPQDGGVLSGPPPRPLPPIAIAVEGNKIYIGS
jgi:Rieske Fe-S protein